MFLSFVHDSEERTILGLEERMHKGLTFMNHINYLKLRKIVIYPRRVYLCYTGPQSYIRAKYQRTLKFTVQ